MIGMSVKKRLVRIKNKFLCKLSPVKYAESLGVKIGGYEDIFIRCWDVEY